MYVAQCGSVKFGFTSILQYYFISTINYRYIAVIYSTIMHIAQQLKWQNFDNFALTNDASYLALTGELWYFFREL